MTDKIYAIRIRNKMYYGGAYIKMHSNQQNGADKIQVDYERMDEAFLFPSAESAKRELERVKEALVETLAHIETAQIIEGDFKDYE